MNKIVCITLNTAIDHIIELDELSMGSTIRAMSSTLVPAGKGVDVAVGVAILGGHAIATGFIGESSRELFEALKDEQVELMFIEVPGATRINVTLFERASFRETHLQTTGYAITQDAVDRLTTLLKQIISSGDVVVIGGSLPPGAPEGLTAHLVGLCKRKGAYVVLDASGTSLLDGMGASPQMIKPNLLELTQIVGRPVQDSDDAIVEAGRDCLRLGVERVVISRGRHGIIVSERGQTWKAWVDGGLGHSTASVGSGDAVVAAFAMSTLQQRDLEIAMRLGVACGAANLLTNLPGRFLATDVAEILPRASIKQITGCTLH